MRPSRRVHMQRRGGRIRSKSRIARPSQESFSHPPGRNGSPQRVTTSLRSKEMFSSRFRSVLDPRLELANELGKVFNMVAGLRTRVQMAFKHIHHTLLLHQGQAIDENEVDLTSHQDWGSMTSSPHLEMMWNSPRNPVGVLVKRESRKGLWEAMHS